MKIFKNKNEETIKELREEVAKLQREQISFLLHATTIMQSFLDNDKRKFMYEIRKEDIELVEDGKKYRAIRKIIL